MHPYSVGQIENSGDTQAGKSILPTPYCKNERGIKFAEQVQSFHVFPISACSATKCLSEGFTPSPGKVVLGVKVAGFSAEALPIFMAAFTVGGPQSQPLILGMAV